MTLKQKLEDNLTFWVLTILFTGFLGGIASYKSVLEIAKLEPVSREKANTLEALERKNVKLNKENISLKRSLENFRKTTGVREAPPRKETKYTSLSNDQLRSVSLDSVARLRDFAREWEDKTDEKTSDKVSVNKEYVRRYERVYNIDNILLGEELKSRTGDGSSMLIYHLISSAGSVIRVANNMERQAKMLSK